MADPRFDNLRRALGEDPEAIKRLRRLFGLSRIGQPPTDAEILEALRGEQPSSMEDTLSAAVRKNRVIEEPETMALNGDPIVDSLKRKLGVR